MLDAGVPAVEIVRLYHEPDDRLSPTRGASKGRRGQVGTRPARDGHVRSNRPTYEDNTDRVHDAAGLQQLIAEYGQLDRLDGHTPQSRGRRFNDTAVPRSLIMV